MSQVGFVNRDNLKIARENAGLTTIAATKKISESKADLVMQWENGESLPEWGQLTKLAKVYNISDILLLSKRNIKRDKIIPDYRVGVSNNSGEKVSKLINLVSQRQKWLEKNLAESGWKKNELLGSGKHLSSPRDLAQHITHAFGFSHADIAKRKGRKDALIFLIEKIEEKGIFVGKTISYHDLEVDDMRGLFISNDYCPYIILNRRDSFSAQIFSLIHELAHFFRKTDAISNTIDFRKNQKDVNPEEIFCNRVAAEFLLPSREFAKNFYEKNDIDQISETYKVSALTTFYRLKELNKIRPDLMESLELQIQRESEEGLRLKAEIEAKSTGGNYTNSMKDSNGKLFNRIVGSSYLENNIGHVEASKLLLFSPESV